MYSIHSTAASYAGISGCLSKTILHEHEEACLPLNQRHTGTLFRLQTNAEVGESCYLTTLLGASVGRGTHTSCHRDIDRGTLG